MSPKPVEPPPKPPKPPKPNYDPRAFRMIPDGLKKMNKEEKRAAAKYRRDAKIAEYGNPKDKDKKVKPNAG